MIEIDEYRFLKFRELILYEKGSIVFDNAESYREQFYAQMMGWS